MKIFITGITGFVGSHCARYFASAGHEVWGIGRKETLPLHVPAHCHYLRADICKPLPRIEADVVIHAAALASDTASFEQCYTANVEGTKNVLAACKHVNHFIHISSSSVYEFSDGKPKKEEDAGINFNLLSPYGKTKWLAEKLVMEAGHFANTTILRPRAVYGKYDGVLLPRLLRLVKGNYMLLPAHLSSKISLTSVNNLVKVVDACIGIHTPDDAVYNVADKDVYSLYTLLTTLLPAVTAKPLRTIRIPASLFDFAVRANEAWRLTPHLNLFAASSLTQQAVLDTDRLYHALNHPPVNHFQDEYGDIIKWIHNEEGWRYYFPSAPKLKK